VPARSTPVRLTYVLTHPVQYFAPWFRHIAAHVPDIDLTVVYVTMPSAEQRGVGFGQAVAWGTPLLEGYRWRSVRRAKPADSVASRSFWSLATTQVGAAVAATQPDVVVVPGWHSAAYLRALIVCRARGIPVLYRGDTHLGTVPAGLRRLGWRAKNRAILRLFDAYLAVGSRAREFLYASGADASRVFESPHCVDNDFFASEAAPFLEPARRLEARSAFGLAPDTFALLFVGKLEAIKRPLDLVRAVARLGRGAAILLVGAGELEDTCRREAEKTGVRLIRTGFLDQAALPRVRRRRLSRGAERVGNVGPRRQRGVGNGPAVRREQRGGGRA
jgi:glycosyltransferase involved in cell wall biosynthesis